MIEPDYKIREVEVSQEELPFATKEDIKIIMADYFNLLDHIASFQNTKEIMDSLLVYHSVYKSMFETFRRKLRDGRFIDYIYDQIQEEKLKSPMDRGII